MKTPKRATRRARALARAQRGMTLVEIMIVVVIMGLIASAVGIAVFNQAKKARVEDAKSGCRAIDHAVQLWQQDHPGSCPTVEQLVRDGVLDRRQRTKDPWDHDFQIACENGDVSVRSNGPDGREGTEDDLPDNRSR
ncbi:MAG: type II secretion system protein GspG [Deltaproteobacteria bacterium]|nr:type II secretion system protein GspG [Deltaproteobacteria bacterium]